MLIVTTKTSYCDKRDSHDIASNWVCFFC